MEHTISMLQTAFAKTFGAALGAAIVYGALFGLVVMLAAPLYLLFKRRTLSAEARTELVREIDAVDRVVTSVYEYLIYFAIAAMTGLAVFFYLVLPDDGNRDFLILYGGVLYLLGMLWASGQLWFVRRRRSGEPARSISSALSGLRSKIDVTFESEPSVFSLDDAALERAAQHRAGGGTLDEACALVVPQYAGMNGIMKGILRKAVEAALEARQK
jgi:hypothetical protein